MYEQSAKILVDKFSEKFPFKQVICMTIESCDPIIAPSYRLFAQTTEQEQVASAMETYGVTPGDRFRR